MIDTSKEQTTADASFGAGHRMNAAGEIWLEARTTVVAVSRSKEA